MAGDIALLPIGQITPNKDQPRTEFDKKALKKLANSIEELGIIQPITVRKVSALKYQLISGPHKSINTLKKAYFELNKYGFDSLDIEKK